jgi:hypothetical protein
MGLDLIVESCARAGHEAEWRRIIERSFGDEELTEQETNRFQEISIPAYERLDAPRVGYDPAANDWIVAVRKAQTADEVAAVLKEFHGYFAVALVKSDGVPAYSHAGRYEGVDETSFRGSLLSDCKSVLNKQLIAAAWEHRFPESAIEYGQALLAAARAATESGPQPAEKTGLLAQMGLGFKPRPDNFTHEEQIEIVDAAGRWFIFWGERGHAIRAWT